MIEIIVGILVLVIISRFISKKTDHADQDSFIIPFFDDEEFHDEDQPQSEHPDWDDSGSDFEDEYFE